MFPFQDFIQFVNNPLGYISKCGIQIPSNQLNNPQQIIQYLMNNGMLSQQQYNQAVNQANQLQKSPEFMQLINKMNILH